MVDAFKMYHSKCDKAGGGQLYFLLYVMFKLVLRYPNTGGNVEERTALRK